MLFGTLALCTIFTILLTLWNSEQKMSYILIKLFCFSSDFDETWWSCVYPCVLQNQMKNKKSFINSLSFCSEFQSVNSVHSAWGFFKRPGCLMFIGLIFIHTSANSINSVDFKNTLTVMDPWSELCKWWDFLIGIGQFLGIKICCSGPSFFCSR